MYVCQAKTNICWFFFCFLHLPLSSYLKWKLGLKDVCFQKIFPFGSEKLLFKQWNGKIPKTTMIYFLQGRDKRFVISTNSWVYPVGVQVNIAAVLYIGNAFEAWSECRNPFETNHWAGDTNALLVANASHMHKYKEKCISIIISTALVPSEMAISVIKPMWMGSWVLGFWT